MFAIFDYMYIQVYTKYYYRWIVFYEVETYEQKCKFGMTRIRCWYHE